MQSDKRFWDKAAAKYAASPIKDMAGYEKSIERTIGLLKPEDHVLELGCGTGTTALRLCPFAASYLATDLSSEMIAIAQNKLSKTSHTSLTFEAATDDELVARMALFDAVLAFNVLHLVPNLHQTLHNIWRMVKPGGLFISKTPCLGEMNPLIPLFIPLARFFGKAPQVLNFSAKELQKAVQDAGFTVLATESHTSKGKEVRPFIIAQKPPVA